MLSTVAWGLFALVLLGGLALLLATAMRLQTSFFEVPPGVEPVRDGLIRFAEAVGLDGLVILELAMRRARSFGRIHPADVGAQAATTALRPTFAELVAAAAYCGGYQMKASAAVGPRVRCGLYYNHPGPCRCRAGGDRRLAWVGWAVKGPELSIWLGQELPAAALEPLFRPGGLPPGWGTPAFRPAEISPARGLEWTTSAQRRQGSRPS